MADISNADGSIISHSKPSSWSRYIGPSLFLPLALKIAQNTWNGPPTFNCLMLPAILFLVEEGCSKNRAAQVLLLNPLKHHYFGSFLYNELVSHNIDKHLATATAEIFIRFVDKKYYNEEFDYLSIKNLGFLLSSLTNQAIIYSDIDSVLGNNFIAKFTIRTTASFSVLLASDYRNFTKNGNRANTVSQNLKLAIYLQTLSSFVYIGNTSSLYPEVASTASEIIGSYSTAYQSSSQVML
ncbi:MAG: hypothetical protein ACK5WS_00580 [Alphaproteobacteria bacterium]